jgi:hypothetical protein
MLLNLVTDLATDSELPTCEAILERIKKRTIAKFGGKWLAGLTKAYIPLAIKSGDETATVANRRPQIEQIFKRKSCKVDSLILLAAAVGCRFQMVCTIEEVEDL